MDVNGKTCGNLKKNNEGGNIWRRGKGGNMKENSEVEIRRKEVIRNEKGTGGRMVGAKREIGILKD